jgi:hypothetical protein
MGVNRLEKVESKKVWKQQADTRDRLLQRMSQAGARSIERANGSTLKTQLLVHCMNCRFIC